MVEVTQKKYEVTIQNLSILKCPILVCSNDGGGNCTLILTNAEAENLKVALQNPTEKKFIKAIDILRKKPSRRFKLK